MRKYLKFIRILSITLSILLVILCFLLYYPRGKTETPPKGYAPLRDDELAERFQPVFDCPSEFGPILAVYYRAAIDDSGIIHIAYHPVWERERNDEKGFSPFLSRILYTGGLSLQRLMYGPGDIEAVVLAIDPRSWKIVKVDYETAADYDPSSFSVAHRMVEVAGSFAPPLRFEVVSWNHLFALDEKAPPLGAASVSEPALSYFSPELWAKYCIRKNPETILRKDRAHFDWERGEAP